MIRLKEPFGKITFPLLFASLASLAFVVSASTADFKTEPPLGLVPWPAKVSRQSGEFTLSANSTIVAPAELHNEAELLAEPLRTATGFALPIVGTMQEKPASGTILFVAKDSSSKDAAHPASPESYRLSIKPTLVTIEAGHAAGHYYATRTLLQLLPAQAATGQKPAPGQSAAWTAPCVEIEDQPRFAWRSFMVDDARNFQGVPALKRYLDEMAALKLNVFHWHFIDNEGWRLEINRYPKLTAVGATTAAPLVGDVIPPADPAATPRFYYTQEEAREIVAYAARRHIRVVPEVEMPGHSKAAIRAYPAWGSGAILDVSNPEVVTALKHILDEVIAIFPDLCLHTGGDEVDFKAWEKTPGIKAAMAAKGLKSAAPLQQEFSTHMARYLKSKGRRMIYWADDVEQIPDEPSVILQFWRGKPEVLLQGAQRGHEFINCHSKFTYLDYNHAVLPLENAYSFNPVPEGMDEKAQRQLLGLGGQIWGEYTPTRFRFELQVFPRLAAVAENAWTLPAAKDYAAFKDRLPAQLRRWTLAGILYTPGADVPHEQLREEVMLGANVGGWSPSDVKLAKSRYRADPGNNHDVDITGEMSGPGRYRVASDATAGADELLVRVVEILENGQPVASDWAGHGGGTAKFGDKSASYVFDLWVKSVQHGAKYTLRINRFGLTGTDTAGDFYFKKTAGRLQ